MATKLLARKTRLDPSADSPRKSVQTGRRFSFRFGLEFSTRAFVAVILSQLGTVFTTNQRHLNFQLEYFIDRNFHPLFKPRK
jgi:hypothetical protein